MINLSENYRISKDAYNIILEEKKIIKSEKSKNIGQETWIVLGYYSCIEHCKKSLVERKIRDVIGDFSKLAEVKKELIEMIEKEVKL